VESAVTAALWVAAALLAAAGAGKLAVPDGAMAALHDLRLPSGRVAARVLGLGEIAVAVVAVAVAGRLGAALLAASYAGLLAVAARARARRVDCGCFGAEAGRVTGAHLAVDGVAATAGLVGVLAWPPLTAPAVAADAGAVALLTGVVLVLCAAALVRLALTALPQLVEAWR
jgi:hypothetical protein